MEGFALDYCSNDKFVREVNPSSPVYSYLSEDSKQYDPYTHAHTMNLYQNLMGACLIKSNKSTVWGETDGFV